MDLVTHIQFVHLFTAPLRRMDDFDELLFGLGDTAEAPAPPSTPSAVANKILENTVNSPSKL